MAKAKGKKEKDHDPRDTDYWTWSGYRGEYSCPHGIGHGTGPHGCDGCCSRDDFPLGAKQGQEVPDGDRADFGLD